MGHSIIRGIEIAKEFKKKVWTFSAFSVKILRMQKRNIERLFTQPEIWEDINHEH